MGTSLRAMAATVLVRRYRGVGVDAVHVQAGLSAAGSAVGGFNGWCRCAGDWCGVAQQPGCAAQAAVGGVAGGGGVAFSARHLHPGWTEILE